MVASAAAICCVSVVLQIGDLLLFRGDQIILLGDLAIDVAGCSRYEARGGIFDGSHGVSGSLQEPAAGGAAQELIEIAGADRAELRRIERQFAGVVHADSHLGQ